MKNVDVDTSTLYNSALLVDNTSELSDCMYALESVNGV